MGSTVALVNQKGGVGKTTVALGLASAAWAAEEQVLVVDLDPLGAATWHLGRDPEATKTSVAELLENPRPGAAADAVVPSAWGNRVHLLPAASRLVAHDGVKPTVAELERLATVLDGLADRYHAILLDCGPHLGALTMSALTAADGALIVVDPSEFGLRGIAPAVELVVSLAELTNPHLEMGGIIVNKMTAHHVENERQYGRADELAGWVPVWRPAIPERIVVHRAAAERQPIHAYGQKATDVTDAFDHLWLRTRRLLRRSLPVSRLEEDPVVEPSAEAEELQAAMPVEG
jgi:chromosome partitioning protein